MLTRECFICLWKIFDSLSGNDLHIMEHCDKQFPGLFRDCVVWRFHALYESEQIVVYAQPSRFPTQS